MAKRQNFVVGSTNSVTQSMTTSELNHGFDQYEILTADELDGVFNAVSDYSNDSSNEIANAIQSITGAQPTGSSENELANALQQMRNEIETTSLTFKGYVATSAPSSSTYALVAGNLWINSATMPTSFPIAASSIKQWDGSAWVNYGSTYTPADFDFFRNINDNEGYYWFGGVWTVMSTDMSTTYFTLNQSTGKWEIKSSVNLPGNPTTTTPDAADQSTKIATTQFAHDFGQRYASNCITEIPQDIKLELNNGTLTLKAGSKYYYPNGEGVFEIRTVPTDTTLTQGWGSSQTFLLFVKSDGSLGIYDTARCYSGTSSVSEGAYYNTNDNKVYVYSGGSLEYQASLPIAKITGQSPTITSIDQVFNYLGYIGSTVFALPGIKGLVPDNRNADGTLKSTAFTVSSVLTETTSSSGTNDLFLNASSISQVPTGTINYDSVDNYNKGSGFISSYAIVGKTITNTGVITSFEPKQAFHAVDYSDAAIKNADNTFTGSNTFTSSPIVPTPTASDNTTKASTTAFVKTYAMGVPDWTNQTAISIFGTGVSYTVLKNGYVYAQTTGNTQNLTLYINGNGVGGCNTSHAGASRSGLCAVTVGDVVTGYGEGTGTAYFVPCKNL